MDRNPLFSVPGLGGYLGAQQFDRQNQMGQLQQINSLVALQRVMQEQEAQARAQQEQQQLQGTLRGAANPQQAIDLLLASGNPNAIALAAKLKTLVPDPNKIQPIGSGGALRPDGTVIPPAARPDGFKAPPKRDVVDGETLVQQELQPDGTWKEVGRGPRFARQVPPIVVNGGPKQKAPVGYRFSADGETLEPIPGGPKAPGGEKPLPTQALKLQQGELDAIATAGSINADMGAIVNQLDGGTLKLGPVRNIASEARNTAGMSSEDSRNYASFRTTLEKLRNDSLRLNKGVQTEGDAIRAWNELVRNITDPGVVKQRLQEIQRINERAIDLRKMNIDAIRRNYGASPLDTTQYERQAPAVGKPAANPVDALLEKYK